MTTMPQYWYVKSGCLLTQYVCKSWILSPQYVIIDYNRVKARPTGSVTGTTWRWAFSGNHVGLVPLWIRVVSSRCHWKQSFGYVWGEHNNSHRSSWVSYLRRTPGSSSPQGCGGIWLRGVIWPCGVIWSWGVGRRELTEDWVRWSIVGLVFLWSQ